MNILNSTSRIQNDTMKEFRDLISVELKTFPLDDPRTAFRDIMCRDWLDSILWAMTQCAMSVDENPEIEVLMDLREVSTSDDWLDRMGMAFRHLCRVDTFEEDSAVTILFGTSSRVLFRIDFMYADNIITFTNAHVV